MDVGDLVTARLCWGRKRGGAEIISRTDRMQEAGGGRAFAYRLHPLDSLCYSRCMKK